MPRIDIDLSPVSHITADSIGQPGKRVFYLQGWRESDPQPVTVILEKIQLQGLVSGMEEMLKDIDRQFPDLPGVPGVFDEEKMHITPPVDPLFRVGELGLGYDAGQDLVMVLVREIVLEGGDPEKTSSVRFWCTRQQATQLAAWGKLVVQRGRPICAQCGQPMEPEGHFCPKKNGHKH